MIRHACATVPYYQALFASAGIAPGDINTTADLHRIPITTKEDLRTAGLDRIISSGTDPSSCLKIPTSGSTGKPFLTYLSRDDWQTRRLIEFRTLLAIGFSPRDRLAVLGPARRHERRLHQRLGLYDSTNISPTLPPDEQLRLLRDFQPTILWVYPTVLKALLQRIDYRLSRFARPRILVSSAEAFDHTMAKHIRADLDLALFDFYGSNELGRIAAECPAHEGLHVNADHLVLECLDDGQAAAPGQSGSAVITTLNAFAMPYIRYHLGDVCTVLDRSCSCGCALPLIGHPRGRKTDVIRLPSGDTRSPWGVDYIMREIEGLDQFRLIQEDLHHFRLLVVFRTPPRSGSLSSIQSRLLEYLKEPVDLEVLVVDSIEREHSKFRAFISNITLPGSGSA
jgi:phenylacetate-CoA ligase